MKGFSGGSDGKESAHDARDLGLIPGLGRSPGERNGNPLQYSWIPWTDKQATGHEIPVKHDWVINTFIFLDNETLFVTASEYKKVWLNIWLIDKETWLQ